MAAACALFEQSHGHFPRSAELQEVQHLAEQHARKSNSDQQQVAKALPRELLADFINGTDEFPAVNAVIGGILANEALKAVAHNGQPINNLLLFSLHDGMAEMESMGTAASLQNGHAHVAHALHP